LRYYNKLWQNNKQVVNHHSKAEHQYNLVNHNLHVQLVIQLEVRA
jgi:hypothetical protein